MASSSVPSCSRWLTSFSGDGSKTSRNKLGVSRRSNSNSDSSNGHLDSNGKWDSDRYSIATGTLEADGIPLPGRRTLRVATGTALGLAISFALDLPMGSYRCSSSSS